MRVLAIDPGRDKCGVCVMNSDDSIDYQQVIETARLEEIVSELVTQYRLDAIVLGNGTTSDEARLRLEMELSMLGSTIEINVVDERHTTELARKLYWIKNPPRGWRRLLPTTMQVPPEPIDHIVAEILARRFLKINFNPIVDIK